MAYGVYRNYFILPPPPQPFIPTVQPPATAGYIKFWSGSAWVLKPVKVWSGSAWVQKPLKFWSGSAWTLA